MTMREKLSSFILFRLIMLMLFFVWGTSEAQVLEANCSVPADRHDIHEFSLCQCDRVKHLVCSVAWHIVIVDVTLGTISGLHCTSRSPCSTSIVCEYKMSEHCDDNQFLDILEPCNGQLNCHIYHNVYGSGPGRNLTCNGSVVPADYTTVRYRCIQNNYTARFDVCGSEPMPSTGTPYTYLTSPGFPIPSSRSKQHRLCCCSVTGVDDFYLLHYDKRTTSGPHINFGKNNNGRFETVDFQNKIANVHIGTKNSDTYYLTWRQTGTADSGVFMASIKGTSSMTVRCGTSGCPVGNLPPFSTNIPTATSLSSGKPDTTAGATIPTSGGAAAQKDDRLPIPMIAGVVVGALVLIAVVIIAVVLLRRKRQSKQKDREYTTPEPAISPHTPNTYSNLNPADANTAYEEIVDPAYIPMGNTPSDANRSPPTTAEDTYRIGDRPVVYQNSEFSDYQNA